MYTYLIIATVIILIVIFLYMSMPADTTDANIKELVKTDINKAREVAKDDLAVFEAFQETAK